MSCRFKGAGQQRLHICNTERESDFFLSWHSLVLHLCETECEMLSLAVLTLELQHHITQVCLDVEFIVRR